MNRRSVLLATLAGILALLWLTASLIGYAYLHKPFSAGIILGFARSAGQMLVMLALLSLAGGIGARLLPLDGQLSLSAAALQAALGLGIQGGIILVIGGTLGFSIWIWGIIYIAALAFFWKPIVKWWQHWKALGKFLPPKDIAITLAALGTGLILFHNLTLALAPPLNFDALTYHLALPKYYLLHGRFAYTPDNMFWGMPQQAEMLFTIGMMFGGAQVAPLIGWGIGILALAGLLDHVASRFTPTAGWVAVISLLAGWSISDSLSRGSVEWPVMLQGLAFMICLDRWQQEGERRHLILAGIFAGLALATKYTAGILLVTGLVVVTTRSLASARKKIFANWLAFAGTALLVFAPWLVKNAIATGSPVYPVLFSAGGMDRIRLDLYQQAPPWGDWRDAVFLPWQATVWGVQGKVGYMSSIGPLLLGLAPLAVLNWRRHTPAPKTALVNAAMICITGFVLWAIASRMSGLLIQSRLYFAFFPAWAVLGGAGYHALAQYQGTPIRFGRLALALSLIAFGFNLLQTTTTVLDRDVPAVLMQQGQAAQDYRAHNLGAYEPAMQLVNSLPPGSRVLMLWETRSFACLPICDPDEIIDRWHHDILLHQSPGDVLRNWQEQGYTHLLLSRAGLQFMQENDPGYTAGDWNALDTLLEELQPVARIGDAYTLYTLESP